MPKSLHSLRQSFRLSVRAAEASLAQASEDHLQLPGRDGFQQLGYFELSGDFFLIFGVLYAIRGSGKVTNAAIFLSPSIKV